MCVCVCGVCARACMFVHPIFSLSTISKETHSSGQTHPTLRMVFRHHFLWACEAKNAKSGT